MRRLVLLLIPMFCLPAVGRAADDPLVQKVRGSMNKAIDYLKTQQKNQGGNTWNWENDALTMFLPGGTTNLVMLSLLTAGVSKDDPVIVRTMPYVRQQENRHTYVVGLHTMVLAEYGDTKDLNRIQTNVDWLIDAATARGGKLGKGGKLEGWTYVMSSSNPPDNSNVQYALLGLMAGRQAGAKIDPIVWKEIQRYYVENQCKPMAGPGGKDIAGWNYTAGEKNGKGTLTMTAAGVSGLLIASLEENDNFQEFDESTAIAKKCGFYPDDDAVAKGLRWLSKEFRFTNPPHTFYNVYVMERVGRLSGQRFIGDHDWYREGCEVLTGAVADTSGLAQKPGGEYRIIGSALDNYPVVSTSFALLFLAKGRTPILISKMAWDSANDRVGQGTGWNRKHHDTRHLVEYSSRELFKKMPLAWQVFDSRQADLSTDAKINEEVSNLLQSPVLYMTGHEAPKLTPAQKKVLKRYVDEGGFILAEACCGSEEFAQGFKALMEDREMFGLESPLAPLSPNHPIWSSHTLVPSEPYQGAKVPEARRIQAIERGCKTVVVLIPQPMAGYWEDGRYSPKPGEIVGEASRGKLSYRLAGNIIAYATGFEPPKPRLDKPKVRDPKDDQAVAGARYLVELAQVRHDGGDWQPAKNALRALALNARDKYLLDVSLAKQDVPMTQKRLWQYKFVYMHGKAAFTTDETEIENMKAHLEVGGTLLADACCGSEKFDASFREFMKKAFPNQKLQVIPENDFLYGSELNGETIASVRCRTEKADGSPESTFRDTKPLLEGIKIDGRWAVIYSKYDIGCALEKNKSSACKGYDPDSAMKLATAALLYSLKR